MGASTTESLGLYVASHAISGPQEFHSLVTAGRPLKGSLGSEAAPDPRSSSVRSHSHVNLLHWVTDPQKLKRTQNRVPPVSFPMGSHVADGWGSPLATHLSPQPPAQPQGEHFLLELWIIGRSKKEEQLPKFLHQADPPPSVIPNPASPVPPVPPAHPVPQLPHTCSTHYPGLRTLQHFNSVTGQPLGPELLPFRPLVAPLPREPEPPRYRDPVALRHGDPASLQRCDLPILRDTQTYRKSVSPLPLDPATWNRCDPVPSRLSSPATLLSKVTGMRHACSTRVFGPIQHK